MPSETIEYRPKTSLAFACAAIFVVTAAILVWLGIILSPDDRAAADGLTRILFTAIPIPLFAWAAAAVFTVLGLLVARRSFRADPTLIVTETSVTLPNGKVIPWSQVASAKAHENALLLILVADPQAHRKPPRPRPRWLRWLGCGRDENHLVMSSFDLGADPAAVAAELESRRAEVAHEGDGGLTIASTGAANPAGI